MRFEILVPPYDARLHGISWRQPDNATCKPYKPAYIRIHRKYTYCTAFVGELCANFIVPYRHLKSVWMANFENLIHQYGKSSLLGAFYCAHILYVKKKFKNSTTITPLPSPPYELIRKVSLFVFYIYICTYTYLHIRTYIVTIDEVLYLIFFYYIKGWLLTLWENLVFVTMSGTNIECMRTSSFAFG